MISQATAVNKQPNRGLPSMPQVRRKGMATRTWLVISYSGNSHVEEVGKNPIMRRTGLPTRDLRILDPVLSYPSSILGRERAIVVNLEHIKAIITASEVLLLNSADPLVIPFVRELECRISGVNHVKPVVNGGSDSEVEFEGGSPVDTLDGEQSEGSEQIEYLLTDVAETGGFQDVGGVQKADGLKLLPFEFKSLEVCLESACRRLENETSTLEQEAYPALDELTSKISTLNLEHVRHIKSRLVGLFGRVQRVRDELENLLDDDMDMAEMYLTDKLARKLGENDSRNEDVDMENESDGESESDDDLKSNKSSRGNLTGFKPNVDALEMLLGAYFAQIEGTLNKLSTLREYVDDTEDYINIMLDDKQNQLLQMGVLLGTANLFVSVAIVIMGIFGMNIKIALFRTTQTQFLEVVIGSIGGCLILYFVAILCGKKAGLLG
ncbi:hypothetical protein Scep_002766 [Stephania cephalantha]|uniref:Magnesium transporter n=1 Tax=Stephania cephalantha TaxID=152367 RepID=A0AAP0Q4X1_9MAGN